MLDAARTPDGTSMSCPYCGLCQHHTCTQAAKRVTHDSHCPEITLSLRAVLSQPVQLPTCNHNYLGIRARRRLPGAGIPAAVRTTSKSEIAEVYGNIYLQYPAVLGLWEYPSLMPCQARALEGLLHFASTDFQELALRVLPLPV